MIIIYLTLFLPIPYHSYHFSTHTLRAHAEKKIVFLFFIFRVACVGVSV